MGINVHIQRLDGDTWVDHPDWDSFRYAGDRDLPGIVQDNGGWLMHENAECQRPVDLDLLDNPVKWPDFNVPRWAKFIKLLREDDRYWVYLSY